MLSTGRVSDAVLSSRPVAQLSGLGPAKLDLSPRRRKPVLLDLAQSISPRKLSP